MVRLSPLPGDAIGRRARGPPGVGSTATAAIARG